MGSLSCSWTQLPRLTGPSTHPTTCSGTPASNKAACCAVLQAVTTSRPACHPHMPQSWSQLKHPSEAASCWQLRSSCWQPSWWSSGQQQQACWPRVALPRPSLPPPAALLQGATRPARVHGSAASCQQACVRTLSAPEPAYIPAAAALHGVHPVELKKRSARARAHAHAHAHAHARTSGTCGVAASGPSSPLTSFWKCSASGCFTRNRDLHTSWS